MSAPRTTYCSPQQPSPFSLLSFLIGSHASGIRDHLQEFYTSHLAKAGGYRREWEWEEMENRKEKGLGGAGRTKHPPNNQFRECSEGKAPEAAPRSHSMEPRAYIPHSSMARTEGREGCQRKLTFVLE